jgi:glucokinase-like ROK family protein
MRSRDARARQDAATLKGADPQFMREHNRLLVLNFVREHGPIARATIARQTSLSRTTVSAIIDALLADELVREGETQSATSAGGRPATLVYFNAAAGYIIGVDMGRSHLTLLLTDLAAQPVARRSGPFVIDQGPDACLAQVVAALTDFLTEQGVAWAQIVGVGMGIPGPMDARLHKLVSPPRMPGWNGVDVRRILGQRLGVPVYVENDANLGALGESRYGAGRDVIDLAYIKIGTGIGGGLVIGGQVYHGSCGSAGEIGHVTLDENGPVCSCGNRGCLEAIASADAIVADARAALSLRRGVPSSAALVGAAGVLNGLANPDIADVVQAALQGDPASRAAIAHAGEHVGVALASLVNLTNPSLILVDGGVARAGELFLDPIRRAVAARSLAIASHHAHILVGELRDNAIAFGGVATVADAAFGPSFGHRAPATAGARAAVSVQAGGQRVALDADSYHDHASASARDPPALEGQMAP